MLHILLLVLKIIGIILGVLLGTILLCLCLALFVPVRYKADVVRTEEEGAPPVIVNAKITWLLHVINIRLSYSTEFRLRARIFLFTVFRIPKKQEKEKKKKEVKKSKTNKAARKSIEDKETALKTGKIPDSEDDETGDLGSAETGTKHKKQTPEKESSEEQAKVPIIKRIRELIEKIYRLFQNIWYTITGICDKIKKIRENIEYYLNVWQSETFRKSFSLCKEELASVFSHIRPQKFQADLVVGTGDPASTAKILSYYGILYPLIGGNVTVVPDFDEKRVEGSVFIKGRIRLFTFIKTVIHIYFSKDIRKLLRLLKKEDA